MEFTVPKGVTVVWDKYNFKDQTVVGRFVVSENHLDPEARRDEDFLDWIEVSLGSYVVSSNARHQGLKDVRFGQFSTTWMDHPYTKDLPKSTDLHTPENHYIGSISKDELTDVNQGIIADSYRLPQYKKYRDQRFRPKEKSDGNYEIYVGVLEEIS